MNKVMNHMSKFIHYFNLSFGVALVIAVALTIGRVYFGGLESLSFSNVQRETFERSPSQDNSMDNAEVVRAEDTIIYGEVGLTGEQMAMVAKNIYHVAKALDADYPVADGLGLAMYVLRYMAEIGEYEMAQKDILILVDAFEKLGGIEVGQQVEDILAQIKKLRFGRRNGKLFAQIFSIFPERGVVIPINERSEDSDSSVEEIEHVVVKNGAMLAFSEITKTEQIREAKSFIKDPVQLLGGFEFLVDELNQIHNGVSAQIDNYFMRDDLIAPPLAVEMTDIYVAVDTTTVFDKIDFKFNRALVLPGISNEQGRLPSFVLQAKAKLLNLKVSVDQ